MRLVIDMQGAQSEFSAGRGVGRYIINLAKELIKISDKDFEIYLVLNGKLKCNKIFQEFEKLIPRSNIKIWNYKPYIKPSCKTNNIDIKEEELFREWFLHQFNADFIWVPNFQEGYGEANIATSAKLTKGNEVIVSTLHDVIPLIYESDYLQNYQVKTWYLKKIKYVQDSDMILTVSNYSKNKIVELLKIDEDKVHVVYNGYDKDTFFVDQNYKRFNSKDKYFLYVGGSDQHKNLYRLIESFSKLDNSIKKQYKLYFAGKEPYNEKDKLLNYALQFDLYIDNIKFLGFVSDSDLRILMQRCGCFVFPSFEEGFGLPPLEAMACGAPVIASNASSIAEIVKYEPALFNPFSTEDIAKKMSKAVSNSDYANDLIRNGIHRAENFLWQKSAENLKVLFLNNVNKKNNETFFYSKFDLINDLNSLNKRRCLKEKSEIAYSIEESTIFSKTIRIYLDVSAVVLEDYVTGIQRTVIKLATNLKRLFHLNENVEVKAIFSDPSLKNFYYAKFNDYKFVKSDNLTGTNIAEFYDGDILILADLHPSNIDHKVKLLKKIIKRGIKVFTILYDLIPIKYPNFFDSQFVEEYKVYLKNIAKFSGVVTISKATMNSYIDWCEKENIKFPSYFFMDYFYLGADIQKLNSNKNDIPKNSKFLLERIKNFPTLLMVGTIEPRKQHDKVLNAVEELWNKGIDLNLIFVGRNGWKTKDIVAKINSHKENGKRLFWLLGISDEYLNIIYEYSSLVVLASLEEGYGLPIIEASYYNKPLLLRDIPVFREVAGDNAFYFKDDSKESFSETIINTLNSIKENRNPSSSNIKFLTWKESSEILIKKILKDINF